MTMGRKRKTRRELPQRVYFRHNAYYFVARDGTWTWLGRDVATALRQYANLLPGVESGKMAAIMDRYTRDNFSDVKPPKAPRTKENNLREMVPLRAVFGAMQPEDVTPQDIYAYMDRRPNIAANREVALLSSVFKHAIRWALATDNPCRLVSRNLESPRRRHVESDEYYAVYERAPDAIQCMMDLAIITGLRLGDILGLNERDNIRKEGLYCETGKTGKKMLFAWSRDLRAVIDRARALRGSVRSLTLIANLQGQRYTIGGFETLWQRTMKAALASSALHERFRFHDLRAVAAGLADEPSELLGHDDPRTTNRIYRRGARRVTPNRIG
jgi:integrase